MIVMYLSVCLPGIGGIGLRVDYRFDLPLHPVRRPVAHLRKDETRGVRPDEARVQTAPIWPARLGP